MQASTRPRNYPGGQRGRHGAQISISDDNHHVTDAISSLYEYGDQQNPQGTTPYLQPSQGQSLQQQQQQQQRQHRTVLNQRPLSFLPSAREEISHVSQNLQDNNSRTLGNAKPLARAKTFEHPSSYSSRQYVVGRSNSVPHEGGQPLRSPADTANASFPLNDIDYESSPAAVAQELSNLQAIRRMSMNVDAAGDPDLPSFGTSPAPPTGDEDEDASKLFWVPARLHPELAPKEFKTFLDNRVESLKRRSGEYDISPDGLNRSGSGGSSLRRKKSMLSRQIDNSGGKGADGYQDGAERLDRKRSSSSKDALNTGMANLSELEELVNDQSTAMQRLSLDTNQASESPIDEDMPILPATPGGNGLRRSTRTQYRRGSLRKEDRVRPSRRGAPKIPDIETKDLPGLSPASAQESSSSGLTRIQSEPSPVVDKPQEKQTENFSRPGRLNRNRSQTPATANTNISFDTIAQASQKSPEFSDRKSPPPLPNVPPLPQGPQLPPSTSREPRPFVSQIASNGRSTARVPAIVETPAAHEEQRLNSPHGYRTDRALPPDPVSYQSSQGLLSTGTSPPPRSGKRIPGSRPVQQNGQTNPTNQTLQHMAAHPSPLPGNSTRTDSLSFIPTLTEDRRPDAKKDAGKKSGWSWGSLLGNEEKEKEKRKEDEAREASKRSKLKVGKQNDNTRLDVLQTTMDGSKGRESLVLDRGDIKLEEERKKESTRKSSEQKKEKDGIFSSIFGGKKKPERELLGKKAMRALSPEPPRPLLKPDVDYNWTRFSILEERAIYRMAHIKLANPRRALYSQVLLSNFMYSYLAKVQQMHPQVQIPQTAAAKAQQRAQQQQQQQQKKAEQPEEFSQYQRYQEQQQMQDQQTQPQIQVTGQGQAQPHETAAYVDDAQNYSYDHGDSDGRLRPESRASQQSSQATENGDDNYGQVAGYEYSNHQPQYSAYQYQQSQFEEEPGRGTENDMW